MSDPLPMDAGRAAWTPEMPLRADATDAQLVARMKVIYEAKTLTYGFNAVEHMESTQIAVAREFAAAVSGADSGPETLRPAVEEAVGLLRVWGGKNALRAAQSLERAYQRVDAAQLFALASISGGDIDAALDDLAEAIGVSPNARAGADSVNPRCDFNVDEELRKANEANAAHSHPTGLREQVEALPVRTVAWSHNEFEDVLSRAAVLRLLDGGSE